MARHNMLISMSQVHAEYLLGAIDTDLADPFLPVEDRVRGEAARRKVARALERFRERVGCPAPTGATEKEQTHG